jgi:hypothetical protein
MSTTPPWLKNLDPLTPILADRAELARTDTAKQVSVTNEADLVFGVIAVATEVAIDFSYAATSLDEDFIIGAGLVYTGDNGAFTVTVDGLGSLGTPVPLVSGSKFLLPIPPDTYGTPYPLTIKALAANNGVAKSGSLAICDRFDFAGTGAVTRTLKTLALSKTYTP